MTFRTRIKALLWTPVIVLTPWLIAFIFFVIGISVMIMYPLMSIAGKIGIDETDGLPYVKRGREYVGERQDH